MTHLENPRTVLCKHFGLSYYFGTNLNPIQSTEDLYIKVYLMRHNTVRSFPTQGQQSAAKGSSNHGLTLCIRLIQHLTRLLVGPEVVLIWLFPYPLIVPIRPSDGRCTVYTEADLFMCCPTPAVKPPHAHHSKCTHVDESTRYTQAAPTQ